MGENIWAERWKILGPLASDMTFQSVLLLHNFKIQREIFEIRMWLYLKKKQSTKSAPNNTVVRICTYSGFSICFISLRNDSTLITSIRVTLPHECVNDSRTFLPIELKSVVQKTFILTAGGKPNLTSLNRLYQPGGNTWSVNSVTSPFCWRRQFHLSTFKFLT